MKSNQYIFVFTIILAGCAALGTKTIYRAPGQISLDKIGFSALEDDILMDNFYPKTTEIFADAIFETFINYGQIKPHQIPSYISLEHKDSVNISHYCEKYQLDGFLATRLEFINVEYTTLGIPISQNYDTNVEMDLYDKNGTLIISTTHNTYKGNSYMMAPPIERTIYDGTEGALKRIFKEMGIKRNNTLTNNGEHEEPL